MENWIGNFDYCMDMIKELHDEVYDVNGNSSWRLLSDHSPSASKSAPSGDMLAMNRKVKEVEIVLGLNGTMFTIPAKVFAKGSSVRVIKLEACFQI
ncbi:hypothetical protein Sjap_005526 [Stephania japonica]|uniref:Uncharacterized protein n=1 Tax=Stephania japonica TaxID=461633 RepID=A0AAP0K5R9_9MAGN